MSESQREYAIVRRHGPSGWSWHIQMREVGPWFDIWTRQAKDDEVRPDDPTFIAIYPDDVDEALRAAMGASVSQTGADKPEADQPLPPEIHDLSPVFRLGKGYANQKKDGQHMVDLIDRANGDVIAHCVYGPYADEILAAVRFAVTAAYSAKTKTNQPLPPKPDGLLAVVDMLAVEQLAVAMAALQQIGDMESPDALRAAPDVAFDALDQIEKAVPSSAKHQAGQPLPPSAPNGTVLKPHFFENEPFATLQCGEKTVHLSYTALNLMAGWLAIGAHGYSFPVIAADIRSAFEVIVKEAASLSAAKHPADQPLPPKRSQAASSEDAAPSEKPLRSLNILMAQKFDRETS